jgi:DNA-binding transcriptional LysR family regulator
MSDYASLVLLPRFLRRLAAEAPNISCHVEQLAEESFDRVESGDLDFCLAADDWRLYANYRPSASIQTRSLFHDDFVCVTDAHHPTIGDELSMEAFKALPHNLVRFGKGITTIIEQAWATAGLDLNVAATSPSFSGLLFMLPGTSLVATAQRRLALALAPSLGLRVFKSPVAIPPLQENLTWHGRNADDPGHAFLRRGLSEAAADLDIEQALSTSFACSSQPPI